MTTQDEDVVREALDQLQRRLGIFGADDAHDALDRIVIARAALAQQPETCPTCCWGSINLSFPPQPRPCPDPWHAEATTRE